jgi:transcriptional regulator with XRE-family HTH domain
MSQSLLLVQALKQLLKSQNMTYNDIAKQLKLSEASIKRMFANQQLSLDRIDAICVLLGIEISDLLQKMQQMSKRITQLTEEQEKIIVGDRKLCLITICVVNRWTLNDILNYYNFSENECIRYLAQLDKIKIIELLPKNKIKLLISPGFMWIPNGPIQKFFQQYILTDFINSSFRNENEEMICQFGMLTEESNAMFRKKLCHLAEEFLILREQDAGEPIDKRVGHACVLMVRPWAPAIFNEFIAESG